MNPIQLSASTVAVVLWLLESAAIAAGSNSIAPGTGLPDATAILSRHGHEVDASKYGLAMVATNPNHDLTFCQLDEAITLVIAYDKKTKAITRLDLTIIPKRIPKAKRTDISLNVLSLSFEDEGIYTVRMKSKTK
jgi:hypothetical protein